MTTKNVAFLLFMLNFTIFMPQFIHPRRLIQHFATPVVGAGLAAGDKLHMHVGKSDVTYTAATAT